MKIKLIAGGIVLIILAAVGWWVKSVFDENTELAKALTKSEVELSDAKADLIAKDEEISTLEESSKVTENVLKDLRVKQKINESRIAEILDSSASELARLRREYLAGIAEGNGGNEEFETEYYQQVTATLEAKINSVWCQFNKEAALCSPSE